MSKLINFLHSIGLSKTEVLVYEQIISIGVVSIEVLEKRCNIKLSTLYYVIKTLKQKNLIYSTLINGTMQIQSKSIEAIDELISIKENELEEQRNDLRNIEKFFPKNINSGIAEFTVDTYTDIMGVKSVIEKALNCKSREWRILAPKHNFLYEFAEHYTKKRQQRKIKTRSLWERVEGKDSWRAMNIGEYAYRNPRYLSKEYTGKFKSLVFIYDDSIAFVTSLAEHQAVVVTSLEISNTMKVMFDSLWNSSEDVLKY
jgi:HTH-type transcriptional regulator, sugar sensing transcriptional regulator